MIRRRKPLRLVKAYDEYRMVTGSAGFIQLFKNGQRIQPKNATMAFFVRRLKG